MPRPAHRLPHDRARRIAFALRLAAFACVALGFACLFSGCVHLPGDAGASLDGLGTAAGGAPAAALGTARTLAAPFAASTAAAVRSAGWLNFAGIAAILAGFVYGAVPALPTGPGVGLALGGLACLLGGVLLPLLSGWVGLGIVAASGALCAAFHWRQIRDRFRSPLTFQNPLKTA